MDGAEGIKVKGCLLENNIIDSDKETEIAVGCSYAYQIEMTDCKLSGLTNKRPFRALSLAYSSTGSNNDIVKNCEFSNIDFDYVLGRFSGVFGTKKYDGNITIEKCKVNNLDVTLSDDFEGGNRGYFAGIITGLNTNDVVKECEISNAKIRGEMPKGFGGIVHYSYSNETTNIKDCKASGIELINTTTPNDSPYNPSLCGMINAYSYSTVTEDCEVSNCTVESEEFNIGGICGVTAEGNIKDCSVKNCNFYSKRGNVGGITGVGGTINNCSVEDTIVRGGKSVGGIIGNGMKYGSSINNNVNVYESLIQNCNVRNLTASGTKYIGGISGVAVDNISECNVSNSSITASDDGAGGIQGFGGALGVDSRAWNERESSGSTTPISIDKCEVNNTTITASTNSNPIQGRNTFTVGGDGSTQDTITNCKRDGVAVTQ